MGPAAGIGERCSVLLRMPNGCVHKACVLKGPTSSTRQDEIYQLDKMSLFMEGVDVCPELNWTADIDGRNWHLDSASFYGCTGVLELVSPRLSCGECVELWTTDDEHGCDAVPVPRLVEANVCSYWVKVKSEETLSNDAWVWEQTYEVILECHTTGASLGVNSLLRRNKHFYEVKSVLDVGSPVRLPKVEAVRLEAYDFVDEAPDSDG